MATAAAGLYAAVRRTFDRRMGRMTAYFPYDVSPVPYDELP